MKISKLAKVVATEARKVTKKAKKEILPGEIYQWAVATLPKEDIDHHATDLYLRVSPKSTELVNSLKYRNSGMVTTFKDNIDGDMWYELPFCFPYVDRREYNNVPSKEEDEIILRQKKSSKKQRFSKRAATAAKKITKKAEDEHDYYMHNIKVDFENLLSDLHSLHFYREDEDDYKYLDLYNKVEKILEEYPEFKIR